MTHGGERTRVDLASLADRERYQLITSLVVPRPIGWISTWDAGGGANLAPFSFYGALSTAPALVALSVGRRRGAPKDTLVNLLDRGAFCVNVVTEDLLLAMNETSAEVGPEIDEFALAGLEAARSGHVDAPFVARCPAVLECTVRQVVDLGEEVPNTLIVGNVVGALLDPALPFVEGTRGVDPEALRPVGRLGGMAYAIPGEVRLIARPSV